MIELFTDMFYTYIQALTEKYGAQRMTVRLPDGGEFAVIGWAGFRWKKGRLVKGKAGKADEPDTDSETD